MVSFRRNILYWSLCTFCCFFSILFFSSCIKEDLDDCPQYLTFDVRVLDADNRDVTSKGEVKSGLMFIFDEKGHKLAEYAMSAQDIANKLKREVSFRSSDLQFVFYGNAESYMMSSLSRVTNLSDLKLTLQSQSSVSVEAPDLFYGTLRHHTLYGNVSDVRNITVDVRRITSMVHVQVIGLRDFVQSSMSLTASQYNPSLVSFDLGPTPDTYCELGKLSGSDVWYRPPFVFNSDASELTSSKPYRIYPTRSGAPLTLRIYYDGKPCFSADRTLDRKTLFVPVVGKTLNILLVLRSDLDIKVEVSDWNVVYQFVEF